MKLPDNKLYENRDTIFLTDIMDKNDHDDSHFNL